MSKTPGLEEKLAKLANLRQEMNPQLLADGLRAGLADKSPHVAALAAKIAGEREVKELAETMAGGLARFLRDPLKTDKGCGAKTAIIEALGRLGWDDAEVYLQGITHVQMEPVFGGKVDTAAELRGMCGQGLAMSGHRRALVFLAELLADKEPAARAGAARAVALAGGEGGAPLLRLRVRCGEEDSAVLVEIFLALLAIDAQESLDFVTGFLRVGSATAAEAAALALGQSRQEKAFEVLREWVEKWADPQVRPTGLLALAMLRQEAALAYLVSLVAEGPKATAVEAVAALAMYQADEQLRKRVQDAAAQRGEPRVTAEVAEKFRK
ncbi:MAG: hypothetical protein IT443_12575 [Phycisphaeraceae bacterium]|nr:hypothetical protein [Phycisphaeraceae bacterium]